MIASGRAIFVGAGVTANRILSGIELVSVPLNEADAKIEVYAAWRKGEDSPAVHSFLDSARRVYHSPQQRPKVAVPRAPSRAEGSNAEGRRHIA